ncbi:hypothetical protein FE257_002802 [Aspergillus nanangensis]|uniref:Uncharacterized protein n=1 Tax=Aspergillus nanangensis TaxID=2582783 RepID=A0AAD4CDJ5_ASPNN|nr:hypothetical protein FE257_002802 [Aspergillus nanangensis]
MPPGLWSNTYHILPQGVQDRVKILKERAETLRALAYNAQDEEERQSLEDSGLRKPTERHFIHELQ